MSRTRIFLLAACFLFVFLAINRVDQLFWTYFLCPKMFFGDTRGSYGRPLIGSVGIQEPAYDRGRKSWPLDGMKTSEREIVVLSGTTFTCEGVQCRLLGVKDSADPVKREQAKDFARYWFDRCKLFDFCNERNPLMESGVSVVWIGYPLGGMSYLSEELVRAGLVTIDVSQKEAYDFEYFDGEDLKAIDWRGGLAIAENAFANGKPSMIQFEWKAKANSSANSSASE